MLTNRFIIVKIQPVIFIYKHNINLSLNGWVKPSRSICISHIYFENTPIILARLTFPHIKWGEIILSNRIYLHDCTTWLTKKYYFYNKNIIYDFENYRFTASNIHTIFFIRHIIVYVSHNWPIFPNYFQLYYINFSCNFIRFNFATW